MAAGRYIFRRIKSRRNPLAYGAFPAPSKMNANVKPKLRSHYPYLVILERVDLDYTQSKFGKNRHREFEIIKKSNLAIAKSPIQDWQFGKTSIAYTMPILYNRAILALI